ncbi:hypothetical protein HDV05_004443 [Chytridiales sp. JEL 0842]|nr:hypothetical protein HDV05_004443 [Chytridiales sp. JEL 0842]
MTDLLPVYIFNERITRLKKTLEPQRAPPNYAAFTISFISLVTAIILSSFFYASFTIVICIVTSMFTCMLGVASLFRPPLLNPQVRVLLQEWNIADQSRGIFWDLQTGAYKHFLVATTSRGAMIQPVSMGGGGVIVAMTPASIYSETNGYSSPHRPTPMRPDMYERPDNMYPQQPSPVYAGYVHEQQEVPPPYSPSANGQPPYPPSTTYAPPPQLPPRP